MERHIPTLDQDPVQVEKSQLRAYGFAGVHLALNVSFLDSNLLIEQDSNFITENGGRSVLWEPVRNELGCATASGYS